ncbi:MAG: family 43 glycosylhydrolase [Gemmatimonadales bacterium]
MADSPTDAAPRASQSRGLLAWSLGLLLAAGCRPAPPLINPILRDGTDYSSDPAPLVANGTLYLLAGRDLAAPDQNDFVMPEWQLLATTTDPMRARWRHTPHFARPERLFRWAVPGRAYAAQIVRGPDRRYYLYAPVVQAQSGNRDPFAIGVAASNSPTGPWTDAHPEGPVVSQSYPVPNSIQNIDPTVLVDDDGRVYLYWGTFGKLKGVELATDMTTFKGAPIDVTTLDGFFEAPWLFKRNGTYYLAYAGNNAGPESPCTDAIYRACLAYGSAPSPLGPWTYRGVLLDPVSSTTSHPGIVEFQGRWYLAYHTADAAGGGHFRRSVAIDRLEWDDGQSPAGIRKVVPTGGAPFDSTPTTNVASHARIAASNEPVPVQYRLRALNDGKVRPAPLPPDLWATWTPRNPPQQWALYQWPEPVTIEAVRLYFWGDQPPGAAIGVTAPRAWHLEYFDGQDWRPVGATTPYPAALGTFNRISFAPVTTRCLRAVFDASTDGSTYAAVALQEWEVLATTPRPPRRVPPRDRASPLCR